jgi:soluble lytic murein transglycosylase-like protein
MTYDDGTPRPAGFKTLQILVALLLLGGAMTSFAMEVYRYSDAKGRAVFSDRALPDPHYQLIWRSTISKLDATFRRTPHRAITIGRRRKWRNKSEFTGLIAKVAQEVQVNAALIHAVVQAESAYNPKALSPAGAKGLMQLMPATARRYGVTDIWDPVQNLSGGAHYLRDLLNLFGNDLRLTLAAYNAGEGAVIQHGNHIPPYPETRAYVRRVIDNFKTQRQQSDT